MTTWGHLTLASLAGTRSASSEFFLENAGQRQEQKGKRSEIVRQRERAVEYKWKKANEDDRKGTMKKKGKKKNQVS